MTSGSGFKIAGLHHIQLAIPPGQEEACRRFWGETLGNRLEFLQPKPLP